MKQLVGLQGLGYSIKTERDDGLWVIFAYDGEDYQRQVKFKPFSNFPIEYINFKGTKYQVNTVKSASA